MYLIIGAGRAASHFVHYFTLKGIPHLQWNRKSGSSEQLKISLNVATKVLLLISDSQLESFYREYLSSLNMPVIHASGALEIPGMISAHPLMTFGPELYSLDCYEKMGFAVGPQTDFRSLFPELANPFFQIHTKDKATYHAWAVYSGNFATLLWKEALGGFDQLGVPRVVVEAYLSQVLHNVIHAPELALTGPLARKDSQVIALHLAHLPEPARSIYDSFVQSYVPEFHHKEVQP